MTWKRRAFLGCGLAVVGLPILGIGGSALWTWRTFGPDAAALEEEHEAARRENIPLTPEDLRPKTPVPDALNAAIPIREAMRLWPEAARNKDEKILELVRLPGASEANRAAAREVLIKLKPVVALARDAASRPLCDFAYDFEKGSDLTLPEMAFLRALARLFCRSAAIAESSKEAFSDIGSAARLGAHAGSPPILICGLVQVAIESMAHQQFAQTLSRFGALGTADARRTLTAWNPLPPFSRCMAGETVLYNVTIRHMLEDRMTLQDLQDSAAGLGRPTGATSLPPLFGPLIVRAWGTRGMQYWRETMPLIRQNESNPIRLRAVLAKQNARWEKTRDYRDILLAILIPSLEGAVDKLLVQGKAERSLRETALALIEANGKDVALPLDLYSNAGETLKLRRDGAGFKLWSVGPDRIDDGGVIGKSSATGGTASNGLKRMRDLRDIVLQYQPPS